jgi:uncharacterized protein
MDLAIRTVRDAQNGSAPGLPSAVRYGLLRRMIRLGPSHDCGTHGHGRAGAMPVFAVTTAKGAHWDHARDIREQAFWAEHGAFADELVGRGVVIIGGPVSGGDPEDVALLAVEAEDECAVRSIFDADPWTVHRVFRVKSVRPWSLWLDGRGRNAG